MCAGGGASTVLLVAAPRGAEEEALMTPAQHVPPPTAPAADRDLLCRLAAGEPQAWASTRRAHEPRMCAIGRLYRLRPVDVDDALQTSWLQLYRCATQVRDAGALGAWLSSTMRRSCLRLLDARRPVVRPVGDWGPYEARLGEPGGEALAVGRLAQAEEGDALWRLVDALPPRQRAVLRALYAPDEPSYAVVSARTGVPIGAIGPTRQRALARLHALLLQQAAQSPIEVITQKSCAREGSAR